MAQALRAGPASMAGLAWLARVGPAPLAAWATAMGWGQRTAESHSRRLEDEGLLRRFRMTRGLGSLFVASRQGVRLSGLDVTPCGAPTPFWWEHDCACAWTAAWLTVRGAEWRGPREVLADPELKGELEWQTRAGWRQATHRPDLALVIPSGSVVVEVELQQKAKTRLGAVMSMYRRWLEQSQIAGIVYVCRSQKLADKVGAHGLEAGIASSAMRIELLESVQAEASGERP